MENQNLLLFDLSDDDDDPIIYNDTVIGSITDVIEQVEAVSPDLTNIVSLVLNQQQKQIEALQTVSNMTDILYADIEEQIAINKKNIAIGQAQYQTYREQHKTSCLAAHRLMQNLAIYKGAILAYEHLRYIVDICNK